MTVETRPCVRCGESSPIVWAGECKRCQDHWLEHGEPWMRPSDHDGTIRGTGVNDAGRTYEYEISPPIAGNCSDCGELMPCDGWDSHVCRSVTCECKAKVDTATDLLGELIDWFGVVDWTGPDLPSDLARRIAAFMPPYERPTRDVQTDSDASTLWGSGFVEVDRDGHWWACPPGRRAAARLESGQHLITQHDDGTVTVEPSIVYSTPDRPDYWHGWVRRGKWIEG